MTLATRCPACGTVFRVVADQLKVSDGWVRCGRCAEVFDASSSLIDLEAPGSAIVAPPAAAAAVTGVVAHAPAPAANDEAPPAAAAPTDEASPAAHAGAAQPAGRPVPAAASWSDETTMAREASSSGEIAARPPRPSDAASAAEAANPEAADAGAAPADRLPADAAGAMGTTAGPPPPPSQPPPTETEPPVPGFVRRAERADRWRSPRRRALLAVLALLLAAALAAQIGLHYRDRIAATWPATRPWLQAACAMAGCRVEPPRRIEALSVESSALLRVEGTALHRLQVVVRNRAATEVRMPAVELTLTDTLGRPLARRVFDARALGVGADRLQPQAEAVMAATLDLSELHVAGYAVEIFYP
jgi:predicted Zn finger-like uncharacterized protein